VFWKVDEVEEAVDDEDEEIVETGLVEDDELEL